MEVLSGLIYLEPPDHRFALFVEEGVRTQFFLLFLSVQLGVHEQSPVFIKLVQFSLLPKFLFGRRLAIDYKVWVVLLSSFPGFICWYFYHFLNISAWAFPIVFFDRRQADHFLLSPLHSKPMYFGFSTPQFIGIRFHFLTDYAMTYQL